MCRPLPGRLANGLAMKVASNPTFDATPLIRRFSSTPWSAAVTASGTCFRLISYWPGAASETAASAGTPCAAAARSTPAKNSSNSLSAAMLSACTEVSRSPVTGDTGRRGLPSGLSSRSIR